MEMNKILDAMIGAERASEGYPVHASPTVVTAIAPKRGLYRD